MIPEGAVPHSAPPAPVGPGENRAALLRLFAFLAAGIAAAVAFHGIAVLIVVLSLVFIVMAHEAGHFVVAKCSGMKVTEYFLGFGPRIWSIRRGETEYGVKAIPAGGYVRIVGMTMLEEVAPADERRSYRQATFPRRLAVAVAGSTVHFLLALGLLWGIFAISGLPTATTDEITAFTNFANATSPAKLAGFHAGDQFVAINGHRFNESQQFISFINAHPGKALHILVKRGSAEVMVDVRPVDGRTLTLKEANDKLIPAVSPNAKPTGMIGVELQALTRNVTVNPIAAIGHSFTMFGSVVKGTALGIGAIFSPHGLASASHQVATAGTHQTAAQKAQAANNPQLLSIVGAIQIGAQAVGQNISELLYILVAINIFVGMFNLFPMLPLDGGHVAIAVYERIRSKRGRRVYHADITKLMPVAYVFLAFVVVLGLSALYVNIVQPASLPGG